ncbi:MAG: glycoside hydrolase [Alicyclobacillus mali]|uniref:sialidase family protein n=1 Tax=Alicyclobacillus mali (ex Roth et al. 2021) TaxID=1123961 RepID=UPI000831054F|nr:sialidase family protein [Alicyclobacillus mali (ex Roth et al. 2021)]MCL6487694.1 glycoside hydrolase [Alicyclobacillus mali (ex Roth et al. 2021)]
MRRWMWLGAVCGVCGVLAVGCGAQGVSGEKAPGSLPGSSAAGANANGTPAKGAEVTADANRSSTGGALASRGAFEILGHPGWGPARVTQVIPPSFAGATAFAALVGQSSSAIIKSVAGKPWHVVSEIPGQVAAISFSSPSDGAVITVARGTASPTTAEGPATYRIWLTRDAGASWHSVWQTTVSTGHEMSAETPVLALFGATGYAAVSGELLRSADGGATWARVPLQDAVLDAAFPSPTRIWLSEVSPQVFRAGNHPAPVVIAESEDGGRTFHTVLTGPSVVPWEADLAMTASGVGVWVVKDLGSWETRVLWTTNGWASWREAMPQAYQGRVAQSVPVLDGSVAYIGLCPGAAPFPGGVTSFDLRTGHASTLATVPYWNSVALALSPSGTWYAAPSSSEPTGLYASGPELDMWHRVAPAAPPDVQVVADPALGSAGRPALVGIDSDLFQGTVEESEDGGASWRILTRMPHQTPIAVAAGPGKLLAVATVGTSGGASGDNDNGPLRLWVSRDGGQQWTELGAADLPSSVVQSLTPFGPSDAALSVTADGYLLAIAAMPKNLVLESRDGVHWSTVRSVPNDDLALAPAFDGGTVWWLDNKLIRPGSKSNGKDTGPVLQPVLTASPVTGNAERTVSLPEGYDALAMAWAGSRGMVVCASSATMDPSQGLTLFVTTDDGATWRARHLAPGPQSKLPDEVMSLTLAGGDFGALLTDAGLLVTRDGGWTWAYAPDEG